MLLVEITSLSYLNCSGNRLAVVLVLLLEIGERHRNREGRWPANRHLFTGWLWVAEPYYASVEAGKRLLRGVRASVPEDLTFRVQVTAENTNYTQYASFRCAASEVR